MGNQKLPPLSGGSKSRNIKSRNITKNKKMKLKMKINRNITKKIKMKLKTTQKKKK
jgi:hypothetical protein